MSGRKNKEAQAAEAAEKGPKTRPSRSTTLPDAPTDRSLDYAKRRVELKDMCPGDIVLAFEATHAWQSIAVPLLDDVEAKRRAPLPGENKRRGKPSQWTAYDFERIELLRRVLGKKSGQDTRDWLAGDRAWRTRELFRMDWERPTSGGNKRVLMTGVPSDGAMSDYRVGYFGEDARAGMYRLLERFLLIEKLTMSPWGLKELDLLYADGSKLGTHYTPPKKKYGVVCNAELRPDRNGVMRCPITAPDAGFVPDKGHNSDHAGAAWNILFISTIKGTILARRCVPMNAPENKTLISMVDELGEVLSSFERRVRVLTADGAFNSRELRRKLKEVGVVENIHLSSHGKKQDKGTQKGITQRDAKRRRFEGSQTWFADGHRRLHCKCGKGTIVRRVSVDSHGKAIVATQGKCLHGCGTIRVQAGKWRMSTDKKTIRRIRRGQLPDWTIGNPLTYHDEKAADYGVPRYNAQEGMFGSQLTQRFKLLKGKRWFRRQAQVEMEVSMVICITHVLSIERYKRMAEAAPPLTQGGSAPPLALAA